MKFTIKDFRKRFPNDDTCLEELMISRFGKTGICPSCEKQTKFHRVKSKKVYECQWCGHQISPTAGTIFHKSSTPLTDWFYVMYLMTATRNGVSAKEVERQLGVTYKCAWRICNKIRQVMNEKPVLKTEVELDETYVGGKRSGTRGRGAYGKSIVFGAVERGGNLNGYVVKNAKANTLMPIINNTVMPGTLIYTDEFRTYRRLTGNNFPHKTVQHGLKQWACGDAHTNNIEGFWSQLKRGILGTHIWVSEKHLQHYVDEFAFRYNQRASEIPMFDRLFQNLVRLS